MTRRARSTRSACRRHVGAARAGGRRGRFGRARASTGCPDRERVEHVVVLGMGGSGIAGDVLAAVAGPVHAGAGRRVRRTTSCRASSASARWSSRSRSRATPRRPSRRRPRRDAPARHVVAVTAGGELGRAGGGVGRACPRRARRASRCRAPASARSRSRRCVVLEQIGLFPGARGWVARRRRAARAPARPARGRGQRRRGAGPAHRAHDAARLRRRADRGGRRDAVEDAGATRTPRRRRSANRVPELCHNEIAAGASTAT